MTFVAMQTVRTRCRAASVLKKECRQRVCDWGSGLSLLGILTGESSSGTWAEAGLKSWKPSIRNYAWASSSPNPHPLLYHCRLRDIAGDDAHVPHVDARNMHKIKDIILSTLLPKLVNFLSAKHHYLPRYSPTMPTGSLAFTYPHPADLSSPVSYSFFPALL